MIRKLSANSGLVRNVLTLFTGSTIAQAIPVLISPILTRLYLVEDFATLTIFVTLTSFIGVIIAGRYEVGIGLPAADKEALSLVHLAAIITLISSLAVFIVFFFINEFVAIKLNNEAAAPYILLVPLAALLYGLYQTLSYWNIRKRYYGDLAASRVGQSVANSGVSLGMAFTGLGLNGLVIGNLMGQFSAFAYTYFKLAPRKELSEFKNEIDSTELKRVASKYSELPKVNGVHALTDMAQSTFVIFLIASVFGSVATGLYGLTMRILQAPLNVIGSSFSIVFYKEVSEKISKKLRITRLLRSTITTLALLSFPVFAVIMIWGPDLFEFVFGTDWRESGVYARILCPWLFLNFIASPVSHLPVILNEQRRFFLFSLIGNGAVILSILAGSYFFTEIVYALSVIASTQVLFQLSMLIFFVHISRKYEKGLQEIP